MRKDSFFVGGERHHCNTHIDIKKKNLARSYLLQLNVYKQILVSRMSTTKQGKKEIDTSIQTSSQAYNECNPENIETIEPLSSNQQSTRMSSIGNIEPFTFDGQSDLNEYLSRMEHIFKVNKVEDELKISFLINTAGNEFHERVKIVIAPQELSDFTYVELITLIKEEFRPVKNIRAERYKFLSRTMKEGETIEEFAVELKNLASTCNYATFLDNMLCDKLILSMRDPSIQKRLMEEPLTKKFNEICNTALTLEQTIKNVNEIQQNTASGSGINWIAKRNNFRVTGRVTSNHFSRDRNSNNNSRDRRPVSYRMRYVNDRGDGREDVICYRCDKKGHYANGCPEREPYHNQRGRERRPEGRNRRLNAVREQENASEDDEEVRSEDDEELMLGSMRYGVTEGKYISPSFLKLKVGSHVVEFEIDTGACVTVMSSIQFFKMFPGKVLKPFHKSIKVISGSELVVNGYSSEKIMSVSGVSYGDLNVVIVGSDREFKPLLGRDWLSVIFHDWISFFEINSVKSVDFIALYPKVFDEDYSGVIKDYVADVSIDRNATPIFHGAYTVPYGLRENVDKELTRLMDCGILVPVKYSRWASPLVVVEKKNGSVRLCMDCRVTINKHVNSNNYPLPLVDDIMNEFANCKFFSKLDLAGAFSQLRVRGDSQEYLTINTQKGLMRFTRLPFGVKSAPGIFQRILDNIIKDIPYVKAYMDDIIVGGKRVKAKKSAMKKSIKYYNVWINIM